MDAEEMMLLTQRVHLQLLPQSNLLQAVVEVRLGVVSGGGRKSEDAHDLPLVPATQSGRETICQRQRQRVTGASVCLTFWRTSADRS